MDKYLKLQILVLVVVSVSGALILVNTSGIWSNSHLLTYGAIGCCFGIIIPVLCLFQALHSKNRKYITIKSLDNIRLKQVIVLTILNELNDKKNVYVSWEAIGISTSGADEQDAIKNIKSLILDTFFLLNNTSDEHLGKAMLYRKIKMNRFMEK